MLFKQLRRVPRQNVGDKGGDDGVIGMIKNYDGRILMLAMQVIKKLLK